MVALYANNASTVLASGINASATSLTVQSGNGSLFPNPTGGDYFMCTLQGASGSPIEIVKCTARSGDTFTIVRAQEGTTASSFSANDVVELRLTAGGMAQLNTANYNISESGGKLYFYYGSTVIATLDSSGNFTSGV